MNCGPRLRRLIFIVGTFGMADVVKAQPPPIDLGTLGGSESHPTGLNDRGQVVGWSTPAGDPFNLSYAFLWTDTNGMVDLGDGDRSRASAVNDQGQVVGTNFHKGQAGVSGDYTFVWTTQDGMVDLHAPPGGSGESRPAAINNRGRVVGSYRIFRGDRRAFSWTATDGMIDLGTLGRGFSVSASAVNNSDQVVGMSDLPNNLGLGPWHAFLWTPAGGMVDLGTLGGPSSGPEAINEKGHVVGWADIIDASGAIKTRAFLWTPTEGMVNLGTLGGTRSHAYDVNEAGAVVGWSYTTGDTESHAFLWTAADGMVDLGTLGGPSSVAWAVNDQGQVVGQSGTADAPLPHGFIWTASEGMVDLAPLTGHAYSDAFLVNNSGQVVGISSHENNDARATMWLVPVDPPVDEWTLCATEGGVCAFTGTTEVRYGASGSFFFQTLTDGTPCSNEVFGDPTYGTVKDCAIKVTAAPPDWTFCAAEGGVCAFSGTMEVRYGANGFFFFQTLTDGTACANEVFGDPISGTVKQCSIPSPPQPEWTSCAPEGGVCAFTGTTEVRYGANGTYVYQTFTDGTACNNEVFGDPIVGVVKSCALRTASGSSLTSR